MKTARQGKDARGARRSQGGGRKGEVAAPSERRAREAAPVRTDAQVARRTRELEERVGELEALQREILSVVSHDLRNPLSVILVSSRLLLRTIEAPGPRRQLEAITRGADEINHIIQDLCDAVAIEAGALTVGADPQEVAPMVARALDVTRPLAAQKPVELRAEIAPGVERVVGDKDRLEQVLVALVSNATKFTPRGGSIDVRAEAAGGAVRFSVSDTGPGIAADQRSELFCRRASGSRRPLAQGSGLGLFVAKGIVEAHGGRIRVESEPGRGSTFWFTVPALSGSSAATAS